MTEYKNKIVFLHKSKKGHHLYAFNDDNVLGAHIDSILMNISEVKELMAGGVSYIKISIMEIKRDEGGTTLPSKPEDV